MLLYYFVPLICYVRVLATLLSDQLSKKSVGRFLVVFKTNFKLMKRRPRRRNDDDDNGFGAWGGYMEAKKSKLLDQFCTAAKEGHDAQTSIFKGISIFVNGYTKPSAEELKQIMALHGGIYHHYYIPRRTMYIIASNLPDTKIKQLGLNNKVVKPNWISESLQAGKLLDYRNYLLYDNKNRTQPGLNFAKLQNDVSHKLECTVQSLNDNLKEITETVSPNMFDTNISGKIATNESSLKSSRILSANDPKFLSEFYSNSRLHHISTLGAMFKQHVSNLRDKSNGRKFPERTKFREFVCETNKKSTGLEDSENLTSKCIIMHIDMDCFFVSVGLRSRPELRGLPVAVTHSRGGNAPSHRADVDRQAELDCYKQRLQDRSGSKEAVDFGRGNMMTRLDGIENQSMSEIASCSYEARKAGVKNGMFMGTALQLCPNLKTIPYDFDGYKEVARTLYDTVSEYTLNIEAVSCDEMFVDVTDVLLETGGCVSQWATYIRTLVQQRTGCPCSTGFGENRLQARMATKTAKPCGQFQLFPDAVQQHMAVVRVDDLPGVGASTSSSLRSMGVRTCGDLQNLPLAKLQSEFGLKTGDALYKHCRGIDERPLVYEQGRKSVSAEVNYGIRFKSHTESDAFLKQLAQEVHSRLTETKMKGKCITLKLMVRSKDAPIESSKYMGHGICDSVTRSSSLPTAVCDLATITREVLLMFQKLAIAPSELRGIGIQISRLEKLEKNASSAVLTKFLSAAKPDKSDNIQMPLRDNQNTATTVTDTKGTRMIDLMNFSSENAQRKVKKTRGRPRGKGNRPHAERNHTKTCLPRNNWHPQEQTASTDIDMEVLAALPEEIRNEVMQQYGITCDRTKQLEAQSAINKQTSPQPTSFSNHAATTTDEPFPKNESVFPEMNLPEIKSLLQNWVSSEDHPEACDVQMLADHFKTLALERKIDVLFDALELLNRLIILKKKQCGWHEAYFEIVRTVQEGMVLRYGKPIWFRKSFKCERNCSAAISE